jgi:Glycosyl transferase family 2/Alpha 1,4-glycosyltransferase conserved region
MTLIAISRVKNELDIIEAFVRHHAHSFEKLIVLDDGSTDGTLDILKALQAAGLPLVLICEPSVGYEQGRYMSRLMRMAVDQYGADWIVPLDADEFLEPADGMTLAQALEGRPPELLKVVWHTFVWRREDDASAEANPVLRLRLRMPPSPEELGKLLIPARLVSDGIAALTQGSHELRRRDEAHAAQLLDSVCLCHFPIRTVAQYAGKIAVGYLQYMATPHWDRLAGFHYLEPFRLLTESVDRFAQTMTAQSQRYSLDDSWPAVGAPRDAPLHYRGGPLSLTPVRDTMLANVLLHTETIAETLAALRAAVAAPVAYVTMDLDLSSGSMKHESSPPGAGTGGRAAPLAWPPVGLTPSMVQQTFQSFWSGGALSPYESLCLRSFIDRGHAFDLYTFDLNLAVPDGVRICDAAELLPPQDFFVYQEGFGKGSPSAFSNLFRYKLLAEKGGWWVDTDVVCLARDIPAFGEFFACEDAGRINVAVMRFERQHPVMVRCLEEAMRLGRNVRWGDTGPGLFTRVVEELGYANRAFAASACYPVHYSEAADVLRASKSASLANRTAASLFVHLWNAMLQHAGVGKFSLPPRGSMLRRWADAHRIDGWRGEYDEETLEYAMRLQAEVRARRLEIDRLNAEREHLTAERERLNAEREHVNAERERLLADHADAYTKLDADRARILAENAADRINRHAEIDTLLNSTSWRLTAPIRTIARLLGSVRRQAR